MLQRNVLLIEDEPNIAEAIRFILQRRGWNVTTETDGARAVAQVDGLSPDAVILDMMLPGRSGLEILAELRARDAHVSRPVLMLTARGQERDRQAAHAAGATGFLAKPFANADLICVLDRMVPPVSAPSPE
ncbi:response regulator [Rhodobacteraceae bacterium]|nr:response regulator [Paracoccaceae bacterium]